MVGMGKTRKGQNMEINNKSMVYNDFGKRIKPKKWSNMYQNQLFLDETGCVLNKKMMPDVTVMVPELEIDRKVSNLYIYEEKFTGPGACILTGRGRGVGGVITDPETQQ